MLLLIDVCVNVIFEVFGSVELMQKFGRSDSIITILHLKIVVVGGEAANPSSIEKFGHNSYFMIFLYWLLAASPPTQRDNSKVEFS